MENPSRSDLEQLACDIIQRQNRMISRAVLLMSLLASLGIAAYAVFLKDSMVQRLDSLALENELFVRVTEMQACRKSIRTVLVDVEREKSPQHPHDEQLDIEESYQDWEDRQRFGLDGYEPEEEERGGGGMY